MPVNKDGRACGFGSKRKIDPVPLFKLIAQGYSYKEISEKLNQTLHATRDRARRYTKAMKARSVTHAVVLMIRRKEINILEIN